MMKLSGKWGKFWGGPETRSHKISGLERKGDRVVGECEWKNFSGGRVRTRGKEVAVEHEVLQFSCSLATSRWERGRGNGKEEV